MSQWTANDAEKNEIVRHLIDRKGLSEEEARQWVKQEEDREVPDRPYGSIDEHDGAPGRAG